MLCSVALSTGLVGETMTKSYLCNNADCEKKTFILNYKYNGQMPGVKQDIVDMAINSSGIRDTARVLKISPTTVINVLKNKESELENVNREVLQNIEPSQTQVVIEKAVESQLDEMWSFVESKDNQRWLWHAIDHHTGKVLAYVFGRRKDEVFLTLKSLLEPFGINKFYTDDWGAYSRNIDPDKHVIGKKNTWRIERKHLTLRTRIKRLARKTICFSKSILMHDIVIGLFVNRFEFGRAV